MLRFGYNTNGFLCHRLADAITIIGELGYRGVGLTLDVHHLDPAHGSATRLAHVRGLLERHDLEVVIETGGRFILDPRRKHYPTLVSSDPDGRHRRLEFLRKAVDTGVHLGATAVSFWAGKPEPGVEPEQSFEWLVEGVRELHEYARGRGMTLAFEPEPGMAIETLAQFDRLREQVDPELRLALDVGHVVCSEESLTIPEAIRRYADLIAVAHIEDIAGREHLHLPFGEGDIDFAPVLAAFEEVQYKGLICVELSRDSHRAPTMAREALAFLRDSAGD